MGSKPYIVAYAIGIDDKNQVRLSVNLSNDRAFIDEPETSDMYCLNVDFTALKEAVKSIEILQKEYDNDSQNG